MSLLLRDRGDGVDLDQERWHIDPPDARFYFREMAPVLRPCRFNDCLHENEPGYTVKPAVRSGEIVGWRSESYPQDPGDAALRHSGPIFGSRGNGRGAFHCFGSQQHFIESLDPDALDAVDRFRGDGNIGAAKSERARFL